MLVGKHFKQKRDYLGLSEAEVALAIRPDFELSLLQDFEMGDDNDIDGWLLSDFMAYCRVLQIPFPDFASLPASDLVHLPLSELIKARRKEKGLSVEDLSDRIGFYTVVVESLENGTHGYNSCLGALRLVAHELDIPFQLLLQKL